MKTFTRSAIFVVAVGLTVPLSALAQSADDAYKDFDDAFSAEEPSDTSGSPGAESLGESEVESSQTAEAPQEVALPKETSAQLASQPAASEINIKLDGWIRNETAFRVRSTQRLSKEKNIAYLVQSVSLSDDLQLKATERAYYDAVYDATDHYPDNVGDDQAHEIQLRDTYVDYSSGDFDVRIGKQQVVWGESVALFFADVVNAKDLREFVLPEFDQIRIPEWGIDVDYSRGDAHAELIYIPFPEMDEIGVQNSEYEFDLPVPDDVPFRLLGAEEPANTLRNSQYGTRLSYLVDGWDLGVFYLYSWNKSPIYYRSLDRESSAVVLAPDFRRQHIGGMTFSKDVSPVVWKGELVIYPNGSFSTFDQSDADGVVQKTYMDYLLGGDIKLFDSIDTNIQFMQRVIFNHEDQLVKNEDAVRNFVSFWAKTTHFDGRLESEFLILSSLMRLDMMIRPSVRLKFADHWDWKVGLDYFEGDPDELLGEFEHGSRAYSELTYRF